MKISAGSRPKVVEKPTKTRQGDEKTFEIVERLFKSQQKRRDDTPWTSTKCSYHTCFPFRCHMGSFWRKKTLNNIREKHNVQTSCHNGVKNEQPMQSNGVQNANRTSNEHNTDMFENMSNKGTRKYFSAEMVQMRSPNGVHVFVFVAFQFFVVAFLFFLSPCSCFFSRLHFLFCRLLFFLSPRRMINY